MSFTVIGLGLVILILQLSYRLKHRLPKEIGIMGGTFNPLHNHHLSVARTAREQFNLDKVLIVPTGQPPHKRTDLLDKEARYEMVAAAVADDPFLESCRVEIDRPGITWSIDTLKTLKAQYGPGVRLNFIIGDDNVEVLQKYQRRAEFLALCRLLISPRVTADPDMILSWRQALPEADLEVIDHPSNGVSSTLIRDKIRAGEPIADLVPPAVLKILLAKGYYLTPPEVPS